jgi:hypothetical protein
MTAPSRPIGWPPSGADLELVLPGEVVLAVRTGTAVDDTTLPCAPARPLRSEDLPEPGAAAEVRWSDATSLWIRPVLVARVRAGVLTLTATGAPCSTQRRRFFRAPVALDVEIAHEGGVTSATACDLSEGGARVRADGPLPLPLTPVIARVRLPGKDLDVPGTVVRATDHGRVQEVGVAFDEVPVPAADAIRKQVLEAQVASRRVDRAREERR